MILPSLEELNVKLPWANSPSRWPLAVRHAEMKANINTLNKQDSKYCNIGQRNDSSIQQHPGAMLLEIVGGVDNQDLLRRKTSLEANLA